MIQTCKRIALLLSNLSMLALSLPAATLADWAFETTSGFLNDTSGNLRDLTEAQATVSQIEKGGQLGGAAFFSGGSYLSVADESVWTDSTMTIEVLFNCTSATKDTTRTLVSHWDRNTGNASWVLGVRKSQIRWLYSTDGNSYSTIATLSVNTGDDYYLALILNNGTATFYLKNLSTDEAFMKTEFSGLPTAFYDAAVPLTVGSTATPSSPYPGYIGRIRIEDEAMNKDNLLIVPPDVIEPVQINGYKGIWFDLGQDTTYGPKYSGGFATYTAKHRPMAVHAPAVNKTFFCYGGTLASHLKHLVIMASEYDHATGQVPKPTAVMDKDGVDDPHDNAAIQIDKDGYVYVFISGRNTSRMGYIFKSTEPYSTASFERLSPEEGESFTYPQIWYLPGSGDGDERFAHFFSRYTGGRELYYSTSTDAHNWSDAIKLAGIQGHYQTSYHHGNRIGTAFNRHPGGQVDQRTDLYYMQSDDFGDTWTAADGTILTLPLDSADNPARVIDYAAQGRLVYMKDMVYDAQGYPVILYLTAANYAPGPEGEPRTLEISRWNGSEWVTTQMPPAATSSSTLIHNYSAGNLRIDTEGRWIVLAPTGAGNIPGKDAGQTEIEHYWGQGGEMEQWVSEDQGLTWTKAMTLTRESERKHGYPRSVENAAEPFHYLWTDGNPEAFTEAHLYIGNSDGSQYWELPYDMDPDAESAEPTPQKDAYLRWQERHLEPDTVTEGGELDREANPDADQAINLLEYFFDTNPKDASDAPDLELKCNANEDEGVNLSLMFGINPDVQDYTYAVQESGNLLEWDETEAFEQSSLTAGPDGRLHVELSNNSREPLKFYRLRIDPTN
ncbi:BNR-4 repeat-containing protein [Coraliomargarita parva]|uniref:BNR-4 repeat-containing protein n=1 Tax=Coraliomargarita parva TaxID=3014050 RepID=UPI0022B2D712|nr:BNR-4 repeat-containing protein [Coraliomargarita parva]